MKTINNIIPEKLKNKQGSSAIEFAIALLIFVSMVAFVIDAILIATINYTTSQQANNLSRTIAIQGGVMRKAPKGYMGAIGDGTTTNDSYYTGSEIISIVKKDFEKVGIKPEDWSLTITGYDKEGNKGNSYAINGNDSGFRSDIKIDYGRGIDVTITYKYKWDVFGSLVNKNNKIIKNQTRHVISEFKYNYDYWEGE